MFRFSLSLISPVLWFMAIRYSFTTDIYDDGNAFIQGGLFWLFCVSFVSSLCWAYAWTLAETKSWLHGGARPIGDAHSLPGFAMAQLRSQNRLDRAAEREEEASVGPHLFTLWQSLSLQRKVMQPTPIRINPFADFLGDVISSLYGCCIVSCPIPCLELWRRRACTPLDTKKFADIGIPFAVYSQPQYWICIP